MKFKSGCSKESELPELIEVKVELPSEIMINKEVELQANVTQGIITLKKPLMRQGNTL
ncbi:hypothetical protein ACFFHH_00165 [Cytobacillus solani]|uniref:hypothetical protein n=1 Tax=Cytobacillus solani TaxID=1637975 RepID=UPI000A72C0A0|nr:hypothetical protein [Cytobacillus solani]